MTEMEGDRPDHPTAGPLFDRALAALSRLRPELDESRPWLVTDEEAKLIEEASKALHDACNAELPDEQIVRFAEWSTQLLHAR
jgi:hypothetical protein